MFSPARFSALGIAARSCRQHSCAACLRPLEDLFGQLLSMRFHPLRSLASHASKALSGIRAQHTNHVPFSRRTLHGQVTPHVPGANAFRNPHSSLQTGVGAITNSFPRSTFAGGKLFNQRLSRPGSRGTSARHLCAGLMPGMSHSGMLGQTLIGALVKAVPAKHDSKITSFINEICFYVMALH